MQGHHFPRIMGTWVLIFLAKWGHVDTYDRQVIINPNAISSGQQINKANKLVETNRTYKKLVSEFINYCKQTEVQLKLYVSLYCGQTQDLGLVVNSLPTIRNSLKKQKPCTKI